MAAAWDEESASASGAASVPPSGPEPEPRSATESGQPSAMAPARWSEQEAARRWALAQAPWSETELDAGLARESDERWDERKGKATEKLSAPQSVEV